MFASKEWFTLINPAPCAWMALPLVSVQWAPDTMDDCARAVVRTARTLKSAESLENIGTEVQPPSLKLLCFLYLCARYVTSSLYRRPAFGWNSCFDLATRRI